MKIERPVYLNELIRSKGNGAIKIITGIRRCGKSTICRAPSLLRSLVYIRWRSRILSEYFSQNRSNDL